MTGEMIKRLGEEQVDGFGFAPDVALAMKANLAMMQTLQSEIAALKRQLAERATLRPE
ncbi:MAG: Transposase [Caballeronia mineralivorans]|jgi:AmiR/NasT family two-component response regulator|nr:Transposase [Caballeronia mineralivorans]